MCLGSSDSAEESAVVKISKDTKIKGGIFQSVSNLYDGNITAVVNFFVNDIDCWSSVLFCIVE